MGAKGWIIFSVVAVALLGALMYFSGQNKIDVSGYDLENIIAANDKNGQIGDHVYGNKDSKVVLIEYGDFQCPGCGSVHPRVKTLIEQYKDDIAFVFRNLPLTSMHPNARAAAATAEAAGKQGKYWEMHNMIFENQSAWNSASANERGPIFEGYARTLGLDIDQFTTDLASAEVTQKINFDLAVAKAKKFSSTPAFTLNGKEVSQDVWGDDEAFEKAITDALEAAGVKTDEKKDDK